MDLKKKIDIRKLAAATNICGLLDKEECAQIAKEAIEGYKIDLQSRSEWEKNMKSANKLALQVSETKSFPWPNAANVKFPLLTVATLQFSARAYPALVKGPEIVKCRVVGSDPKGEKRARAARVGAHMSYQIFEEDEGWEEDHDKLLMVVPIAGCAFKKSYYSPADRHNISELVLANDLIINYYAKSVEDAERKTHRYSLWGREIKERELNGMYRECDHGNPNPDVSMDDDDTAADERQGIEKPPTDVKAPYTILEQHLYLDLDGDGYDEPYVATIVQDSEELVRLVNRFERVNTTQDVQIRKLEDQKIKLMEQAQQMIQEFQQQQMQQAQQQAQETGQQPQPPSDEMPPELTEAVEQIKAQVSEIEQGIQELKKQKPDITSIDAMEYFTKYGFVPSPDGGIYDLGFGALLGPINESVNTLINQLIDSGTMQNGSTGFLGRGARIKGGEVRFRPYEWKRVDVAGSTLRDSIVLLPVAQPSPSCSTCWVCW